MLKSSLPAVLFAAAALAVAGRAEAQGTNRPDPVAVSPAEHPADCVGRTTRIPDELAAHLPDHAAVFFEVTPDGRVTHVHANDAAVEASLPYLRESLTTCRWTPGKDAQGKAVPSEVELKLRFVS